MGAHSGSDEAVSLCCTFNGSARLSFSLFACLGHATDDKTNCRSARTFKLVFSNSIKSSTFDADLPGLTAGGPGQFSAVSPAADAAPKVNPFLRGAEANITPPLGPLPGSTNGNQLPGPMPGPSNQVGLQFDLPSVPVTAALLVELRPSCTVPS